VPRTPIKLGVVMDPIAAIKVEKDSTFAMLLEGQARGWRLHYIEQRDLSLSEGRVIASARELRVEDSHERWFSFGEEILRPLADLDLVLMRKDPPFDMEYIYTTYLLELAEREGTLVANRPRALRDANEKLFTALFPQCTPETLVTRDMAALRRFITQQGEAVVKPLDGMGGTLVFRLAHGDPNTNVALETLTDHGRRFAMAQRFISEISEGDKRILLVDGEPIPYALARVPPEGESRGNLAVGGRARGVELTERDRWICAQVGPTLREMGLTFAGLDVIGDYLTEINVTSPTCIRELDRIYSLNIAAKLLDCLESHLEQEH
jgi:glutathione synthase